MKSLLHFTSTSVLSLVLVSLPGCRTTAPTSSTTASTSSASVCPEDKIVCPDGTTVYHTSCPEKLYEDVARKSEVTAKAGIDILGKIKLTGLETNVTKDVQLISKQLDQFSSRAKNILKFAAIQSNNDPCNKELKMKFVGVMEEMNKQSAAIGELEQKVANSLKGGGLDGSNVNQPALKTALAGYKADAQGNLEAILKAPVK